MADIVRPHRRVCLLRASGNDAEAARLERTELAEAWNSHRASGDPTPVAPLLAAEEARVAEAVLLVEMLVPLLADRMATRESATSPQAADDLKAARRETAKPFSPFPGTAPSVADFIEGMLAQDRATARAR